MGQFLNRHSMISDPPEPMENESALPTRKEIGIFAQGGQLVSRRALSADEYLSYTTHSARLRRFADEQQLFVMVRLNHQDYLQALTSYRQGFITGQIFAQHHLHAAFFDLNRRVLNLLSSVRTFLDHTETNLNRPGRTEQLARFKKECSAQYDQKFAYRFLYKLRNYAQHCGVPASGFETGKRLPNSNTDKKDAITVFRLLLRRADLEKYESWGPIKEELSAKPETFELDGLLQEMVHSLYLINKTLIKEDLSELSAAVRGLDKLIEEVEPLLASHQTAVPIIFEPELKAAGPPRQINLKIQWFPLDVMDNVSSAFEEDGLHGTGA